MRRRDLLRAAAASAALVLLPRDAEAAWARALGQPIAADPGAMPETTQGSAFSATQRATLLALADALIPRTDTPGANDVRVIDWIDVIMADYYSAEERTVLTTGLDAIEALAQQMSGRAFASLTGEPLTRVMTALDGATDRTTAAAKGYQRAKGLVVHGYFTSARVQREVLKTQIMPGRFVGDAPLRTTTGGSHHE
jgi:hypothetical protein